VLPRTGKKEKESLAEYSGMKGAAGKKKNDVGGQD